MEELIRFIALAQTERFTLTELCEQFGISRKTAYKHLERYALGGFKALEPRSSRPLQSPDRTEEAITELILLRHEKAPPRFREGGARLLLRVAPTGCGAVLNGR
jgi:transposase